MEVGSRGGVSQQMVLQAAAPRCESSCWGSSPGRGCALPPFSQGPGVRRQAAHYVTEIAAGKSASQVAEGMSCLTNAYGQWKHPLCSYHCLAASLPHCCACLGVQSEGSHVRPPVRASKHLPVMAYFARGEAAVPQTENPALPQYQDKSLTLLTLLSTLCSLLVQALPFSIAFPGNLEGVCRASFSSAPKHLRLAKMRYYLYAFHPGKNKLKEVNSHRQK